MIKYLIFFIIFYYVNLKVTIATQIDEQIKPFSDKNCNIQCSGANFEMCGGLDFINLYQVRVTLVA